MFLSKYYESRNAYPSDKRDAKARIEQNIREFLRLYLFTASLA